MARVKDRREGITHGALPGQGTSDPVSMHCQLLLNQLCPAESVLPHSWAPPVYGIFSQCAKNDGTQVPGACPVPLTACAFLSAIRQLLLIIIMTTAVS